MDTKLTEITVVGDDDTGLLARITSLLFENNINIEDLDQEVKDDVFRMTMRVDTSEMDCSENELEDDLATLCEELDVDARVRFTDGDECESVAVLVTKESHCLQALLEEAESGELGADIDVVIGNHAKLQPLAEKHDVPFHDIGDEEGVPDEDELIELLDKYDVDLIALARYIRILSPDVVFRYQNRIINVHPSLLPAFPGAAAYMQAIEEGVRIAGVTAHYVTPDLDQGPIITQRAFNVPDDATEAELEERGQPLEADALIEAIKLHLNNDIIAGKGRTNVQADDTELGLPEEITELNPDGPVDKDSVKAQNLAEPADD
ncbi:formyltetrahydrofolate deformylase [Halostagnicola sp. A-GB9-2]|uniref:formyltetrahydrofolate deformylase n=1 Tax=Halostagnicola sp. A-GB9-2 TaxID=3048066 RepID=UPI0024C02B34|nr:formyltetrahydrofolate deformylase [Halostagnicola sp. A-GB9-2]MDJ1434357.1 formyltetrahydrofolate deformylase [Halostagnicola sp. A-GB9-2]